MKYLIIICLLLFCCSGSVLAQDVDGGVTLAWDANLESDLAGYKIYHGIETGNYDTVIDVTNVINYTVSSLTPSTLYYFVVTAYDLWGNESKFSAEVSATAKDIIIPGKVQNVREVTPSVNNAN